MIPLEFDHENTPSPAPEYTPVLKSTQASNISIDYALVFLPYLFEITEPEKHIIFSLYRLPSRFLRRNEVL